MLFDTCYFLCPVKFHTHLNERLARAKRAVSPLVHPQFSDWN